MKITINGEEILTQQKSLNTLLKEHNFNVNEGGFAVAVNDTVIPKNKFNDFTLSDEDHIEIVRAAQGG